ncbi:hypothetical protein GCM10017673_28420 [Streptosporangium violaceochromogenes]|nr:hypothetical protein GCM10017673_28420 [Streptosporangium violaceochromogenes]
MPDRALKFSELSVLVVLMVEAREVSNPELKERHGGMSLDGKTRIRLNDLKLVESHKRGRSYAHTLTDAGWARVAEEFRAGAIPAPRGTAGAMARALATGIHAFLERTDHLLAEVFQPRDETDPAPETPAQAAPEAAPETRPREEPSAGPDPREHPGTEEPRAADVEARIRTAYTELAPEAGAWVSLTRLRPLLGDVARAQVDDVLTLMNRMPDVNIVPESNRKALSPQDRNAAVTIGDQEKHLLSIGAR